LSGDRKNLSDAQKDALVDALVEAISADDIDMVRGAIAMGADMTRPARPPRSSGYSRAVRYPPLHWATCFGSGAVLREVAAHCASLEIKDDDGNTALLFGIMRGDAGAVLILCGLGADPLAENKGGEVALGKILDAPAGDRRTQILKALLTKNAALSDQVPDADRLGIEGGVQPVQKITVTPRENPSTPRSKGKNDGLKF
jgi:hypothetical protein